MTDMAAASPDDDTPDYDALPRRAWSGKRVMLVALPVVAVLASGVGAWSHFQKSKPAAENAAALEPAYVELPDMLVNLSSGPARARFLKLGVTLEVKGEERAASIKKRMPRILDSFQIYLRELRLEDLNGSAGTFLLKEELLRRVNTEIAPDRVEDVLFKEMMTHEQ
jgi:flagellar FliL protein